MRTTEYWFDLSDATRSYSQEWRRVLGLAVGAAARAVDWSRAGFLDRPWVEIRVGTVKGVRESRSVV